MNTTFKKGIVSPYQMRPRVTTEHPIQEEIKKNLGELTLTASFSEDRRAQEMLKIPNLVTFLCTLRVGKQFLCEGHGMSLLGKTNRWIERGVNHARGQSLLDAVAKSTKVLEAIELNGNEKKESPVLGSAYQSSPDEIEEPITDRQRSYLTELINMRIEDNDEREKFLSSMASFSKSDASEMIAELANK